MRHERLGVIHQSAGRAAHFFDSYGWRLDGLLLKRRIHAGTFRQKVPCRAVHPSAHVTALALRKA
jgi:hypothetical protein